MAKTIHVHEFLEPLDHHQDLTPYDEARVHLPVRERLRVGRVFLRHLAVAKQWGGALRVGEGPWMIGDAARFDAAFGGVTLPTEARDPRNLSFVWKFERAGQTIVTSERMADRG